METKRILVVGSANMDFIMNCERLPSVGETILSYESYTYAAGGKGANCAVAASLLGADVLFCTLVGNDNHGVRLRKLYSDCNIDPRFITIDSSAQTGLAVVMVEKNGNNRITVYPGANFKLCERDIDDAVEAIPDAILTQFEIGEDIVLHTAKRAKAMGIPLFIDAGPARRNYPIEKLEKIEILSPNENETEMLTGIRPADVESCLRASAALYNRAEIKYVVLKLGERGCFVYDGKYCDIVMPYDVEAIDTTAAGDAFTSALTYRYMTNGKNISDACNFANAAGALTTTKRGAAPALPELETVEAFMRKCGRA